MRSVRALAGAAGLVAVLTLVSRLFGLLRKLAQSWALSDSAIASAYDTANTVPNVLFEVAAGGALAGAVIPILSRFVGRGQGRLAGQTVSALATWILSVGTLIAVVVAVFADPLAGALLAQADPATSHLAALLLRVFAAQVPLYGLSVVATGVLHSYDRFFWPALSPLLSSISVTAMFLVYATRVPVVASPADLTAADVALLAWGTTFGVVLFSLPQLVVAGRCVRLRPTFTFPPGVGRETIRLGAAGLGALAAQQIAIIAIMLTANRADDAGTYAAFNYAYAIFMVPYAVLAVPIATVTFPQISAAAGDRLRRLVAQSTRLVLSMGIVCAALLIVLSRPAKIVLEVGRDIQGLDTAMQAMGVGLVGFSLLYHGVRVLYARGEARRVIIVNSVGWGVVVACLVFMRAVGVSGRTATLVGMGASMSVGLTAGGITVLAMIHTSLGAQALAGMTRVLVLVPVAAASGALSWALVGWILEAGGSSIVAALGAAVAGGVVIIGTCLAALHATDRQAFAGLRR